MPMVEANGLQVAYEADGDGPPLIVLHEAGSTGAVSLGPAVDGLSSRFRVFRADARGHGATRWDAADGFTTADLVADVIAFADALGVGTFHLLGFSMGGDDGAQRGGQARRPAPDARRRSGSAPTASRGPASRGTPWTPSASSATTRRGRDGWTRSTTRSRVRGRGTGCCRRSPTTSPSSHC